MKVAFYFFFLFLITGCNPGKKNYVNYEKDFKPVRTYFNNEDFILAANKFSELYTIYSDILDNDKYIGACSYVYVKKFDLAIELLLEMKNDSSYTNYFSVADEFDLEPLHKHPKWLNVITHMEKLKLMDYEKYKHPAVPILDTMRRNDQHYRQRLDFLVKKYGNTSTEVIQWWQKINHADSENTNKLRKIIDKYGWLSNEIVGSDRNKTLFLVLQHSYIDIKKEYRPIILKAAKENKANWQDLAFLEDRIYLDSTRLTKQLYGTQLYFDEALKKFILFPIEDSNNVEKRRKSMNLPPLSEYMKRWE